ncbi:leucine Rich Repeat [Seminavis robusta]|uniref:Leucine Rich Repeat n=1 Tax=Seminavis robusta TaxID=568900 RepID=A0A9N8EYU2_9STRA|nr:leucine Rich Repeat [Seminavis robusta]|eukprot:Sro2554_g331070.1 leucine Rich Repeat (764) ;mRNA; f:9298-11668
MISSVPSNAADGLEELTSNEGTEEEKADCKNLPDHENDVGAELRATEKEELTMPSAESSANRTPVVFPSTFSKPTGSLKEVKDVNDSRGSDQIGKGVLKQSGNLHDFKSRPVTTRKPGSEWQHSPSTNKRFPKSDHGAAHVDMPTHMGVVLEGDQREHERMEEGRMDAASCPDHNIEAFGEYLASSIEPLPSPNLGMRVPSEPGAFAQPGPQSCRINSEPFTIDTASNRSHQDHSEDPSADFPEMDDLVVARPVNVSTINEAEPVDPKERSANSKKATRAWRFLTCLLLLAPLTAVLTVILVARKQSHPKDNITDELGHPITNISHDEIETPIKSRFDLPLSLPNSTMTLMLYDDSGASPQSKAYEWLRADPLVSEYTEARLVQRFAIATLYYSLGGPEWLEQGGGTTTITVDEILPGNHRQLQPNVSTAAPQLSNSSRPQGTSQGSGRPPPNGPPPGPMRPTIKHVNITSAKWLSYGIPECEWFSLGSLNSKEVCNEDGSFRNLHILQNNLVGTLPEELMLMTSLQSLKLARGQIGSTIFTQIGQMTQLTNLRLFSLDLTGTIPSEVGLLSNTLEGLSLLDNQLTGSLPEQLWQLSHLKTIIVGRNSFGGSIASDIGYRMPKIQTVMLDRNQFSGVIPSSLGLCTNLKVADFDGNPFIGQIPSELGQAQLMHRLFLADTNLSGSVPSELGLLTGLRELRLSNNPMINGSIPLELEQLNESMHTLLLEGTSLTGTIPQGLCGLHRLSFDCSPVLCGCDCPCSP